MSANVDLQKSGVIFSDTGAADPQTDAHYRRKFRKKNGNGSFFPESMETSFREKKRQIKKQKFPISEKKPEKQHGKDKQNSLLLPQGNSD